MHYHHISPLHLTTHHHHTVVTMAFVARALADFTKARPGLHKIIRPIADKYLDLSGYRKIGLVYASPALHTADHRLMHWPV